MRPNALVALLAIAVLAGCHAPPEGEQAASEPPGKGGSGVEPKAAVVVPEGTALPLVLETSLSSKASGRGDIVVAKLASDVKVGEAVVLPAGTEVRGQVITALPSGKVKGRARLSWDFDRLVVGGVEHKIEARAVDITAPDNHKRDGGLIAGGAGAGALIGALVDGKHGAAVGALVGGAAGTGVVLTNTGQEVVVPSGSRISIKLTRDARLG
jgi:hypothetical protein